MCGWDCVWSRIFVGTWNVVGKLLVGSLIADLEEWLNLKGSVDIYVFGWVNDI